MIFIDSVLASPADEQACILLAQDPIVEAAFEDLCEDDKQEFREVADALKKNKFRKNLAFFRETRAKARAKGFAKAKAVAKPKAKAEISTPPLARSSREGPLPASSSSSSTPPALVAAPKAAARVTNLANQVEIDGVTYTELWRHEHTEFHGYTLICPTCNVRKDLHFLNAESVALMTPEECRLRLVRWAQQCTGEQVSHRKSVGFGRNLKALAS